MRTLNQHEAFAVSGGFLNAEQITYVAGSAAPMLLNLGYQVGLKALGVSNPGLIVNYVLLPALNIVLGGVVTEGCKQYFCEKAS